VSGDNLIGRGHGPLFEADGYLSPRHATLTVDPSGIVLRDTDSLNGVFVKLVEDEEIGDGDVFRIGQELIRFDTIRPPEALPDGTQIMGSPNPGYWGRLALIVGQQQEGSAFPVLGDTVVLGRERGDILFPEDGYVSGTHARISLREDRIYLSDLNSSNGTFLRVRKERTLQPGSFVLMGQQLFRIAIP
jgi:pSer/pThr/pTyr-binding forkhead associated (FHA) protein